MALPLEQYDPREQEASWLTCRVPALSTRHLLDAPFHGGGLSGGLSVGGPLSALTCVGSTFEPSCGTVQPF
jgi:hypothetical protein